MVDISMDYNTYKLKNGINVVSIKKDTEMFAIHVGVKVGSLYEKPSEKGISHFIEHMLFKGTYTYDNEELISLFEECAGEFNAYTDYNSTVFNMSVLKEEGEKTVSLLAEILKNSAFKEEEIEKERGVILAEILSSKDDIEDYSYGKVNQYAFSKSPLKYDIIGEEKTVSRFKREDIVAYYKKFYVASNIYISVVSSFTQEETLAMINKFFGGFPEGDVFHGEVINEKNIPSKKISYKTDIEQATILYLYTFYNLTREEELSLKLLSYKLGESANCILFRRLREERGIAYDAYSQYDTTKDVKIFYIYTAVSKDKVGEALEVIDNSILELINEKIILQDSFVELMKKVLKTSIINTIEDTSDLSNYALSELIEGRRINFLEDMKELKSITKDDIFKVAKKVFLKPTIHILMPRA